LPGLVILPATLIVAAAYDSAAKQEDGGGVHNDGEDIETIEMRLDDALDKVASGEIRDGKTIMLLQYAKLHLIA